MTEYNWDAAQRVEPEKVTGGQAFDHGFLDSATIGLGDELRAGGDSPVGGIPVIGNLAGALMDSAAIGADKVANIPFLNTLSEDAQVRRSGERKREALGKVQNPKMSMFGTIAGLGVPITGELKAAGMLAKSAGKAKAIGQWAQRNAFTRVMTASGTGAVTGAAEGFNEQQSVLKAFAVGGAMGGLGQLGLVEVIGRGWKMWKGAKDPKAVSDAVEIIVDRWSTQTGIPREDLPIGELQARIKELGPNATLAESNEVIADIVYDFVGNPHTIKSSGQMIRRFTEASKSAPKRFGEEMNGALGSTVLGKEVLMERADIVKKALSPQYGDVFRNSNFTIDSPELMELGTGAMLNRRASGKLSPEQKNLQKWMQKRMGAGDRYGVVKKKGDRKTGKGVPLYRLTAQQLHDVRLDLDDLASSLSNKSSKDKILMGDVFAMRSAIDQVMKDNIEGLGKLDTLYTSAARAEVVHSNGKKLLNKNLPFEDVQSIMRGTPPSDLPVLIESAKGALLQKHRTASQKSLWRDVQVLEDNLTEIVGAESAKRISLAAESAVIAERMGKKTAAAARKGAGAKGMSEAEMATRGATVLGSATGVLGQAIGAGNVLSSARSIGTNPTRTLNALDTLMTGEGAETIGILQAMQDNMTRGGPLPTPIMGASGGSAGAGSMPTPEDQ
jgi:hypothetical protein